MEELIKASLFIAFVFNKLINIIIYLMKRILLSHNIKSRSETTFILINYIYVKKVL
jgi:hypothetical protein